MRMRAFRDYLARLRCALLGTPVFTCWHCGESFTERTAAEHYGAREPDKGKRRERSACVPEATEATEDPAP